MRTTDRFALAAAALLAFAPAATLAQTAPPEPVRTMAPAPSPVASEQPSPAATAPAGAPTAAPSAAPTSASRSSLPGKRSTNVGNSGKHIKKIPTTTLTDAQVQYALSHVPQTALKLRAMKKISFKNLSVYHLTPAQRAKFHVAMLERPVLVASLVPVDIAQTGGTAANILQDVLANVNVSDALNNVLNGTNVGVTANVSLADVLNNVNVGVGQVVGIYIGSGGKVTTIAG